MSAKPEPKQKRRRTRWERLTPAQRQAALAATRAAVEEAFTKVPTGLTGRLALKNALAATVAHGLKHRDRTEAPLPRHPKGKLQPLADRGCGRCGVTGLAYRSVEPGVDCGGTWTVCEKCERALLVYAATRRQKAA